MDAYRRATDPRSPATSIRERRAGAIPERALSNRIETANRFDHPASPIVVVTLGPWFREDVPANAGTIGMRLPEPTAATVWAESGTGVEIAQARQGRGIGAALWVNADVTAGSITVGVRVANGATLAITDCVLSTAQPRRINYVGSWAAGIPFAAGETIEPALITPAGLLPITLDATALLYVAFEAL